MQYSLSKRTVSRILREPLVHFLVVGALLFAIFEFTGSDVEQNAAQTIVVDRETLLNFVQLRSKTLSPAIIRTQFKTIPRAELNRLIERYVRDEALYREAKAMGLDQDDLGIRQSLIRQFEFINQGVLDTVTAVSDDEVKQFYEAHADRYLEPPTITFTHVFFSSDRRTPDAALELATHTLQTLNDNSGDGPVSFSEAPGFGDRFLFRKNYVSQEADEVRSHFGPAMQTSLFAIEPDETRWHGPFQSEYGYHLVMVVKSTPARLPTLAEIRGRVQSDAYRAKLESEVAELERRVIDKYNVVLNEDLSTEFEHTEPDDMYCLKTDCPSFMKPLALVILAATVWPVSVLADDNRPLFVEITQTDTAKYDIAIRVPPTIPPFNRPTLVLPDDCQTRPDTSSPTAAAWGNERCECATPLQGRQVSVNYPIAQGAKATVARFVFPDGASSTVVVPPGETGWEIPLAETRSRVAWDYFQLGVYHIWEGTDHLLFVVCLIFIAGNFNRIMTTITGFTIAHSITLALSALDWVRLPVPPIEACIALSVVFLAVEVCKKQQQSLTWRHPVSVSSVFGLLHGLGFAAVLNEIGLPQKELLTGLFFFNVGVEVGQVVFAVAVVGGLWLLGALISTVDRSSTAERRLRLALGYMVGCVAAYWLVDRVAGFV